MLHLEHRFIWCWNLDASGSRSETPGKFWNVVLEKDGDDQLDRSCDKWRSRHIFRRNCILQQVIEGKENGRIEVTGRRGRRRRKLLDYVKERRGYCHLKEEALDCTMWSNRFGRGFGTVVRHTTKWMTHWLQEAASSTDKYGKSRLY